MRKVSRQFGTNWFTVIMGVGIVAGLLFTSPIPIPFGHAVAMSIFALLNVIFLIALALWIGRWVWHFRESLQDFKEPGKALFYGALAMGINVVGNDYLFIGPSIMPEHLALTLSKSLWIAGTVISLFTVLTVPYLLFVNHRMEQEETHASWLIPVVTTIVAAATGLNLLPYFHSASVKFDLTALDLAMFGMTVFLFIMISGLFYARLVYHRRLDGSLAPGVWIEIGPIGMSMATFATLPHATQSILAPYTTALHAIGLVFAIAMWGVGLWWIVIASLFTVLHVSDPRSKIPYNLGWWSYVFPLGSFTNGTYAVYHLTNQTFFAYMSLIQFIVLCGFFSVVFARTLHGVWNGSLLRWRRTHWHPYHEQKAAS